MLRATVFAALFWMVLSLAALGALALLGHGSSGVLNPRSLALMILIQTTLLVVPSQLCAGMPVGRRHLLFAFLVSGLLLGVLVFGLELAIGENTSVLNAGRIWMIAPVVVWLGYALLMYRRSGRDAAKDLLRADRRTLLIAAAVTLVVAIVANALPLHGGGILAGIGALLAMILGTLGILLALGQIIFARMFPGK